ncbi:MAG: hypothetical protein U0Z17_06980 [Bacteroidales bacterium]
MKNLSVIILLVSVAIRAAGQHTPMEYLNAIPNPPSDPCGFGISEKAQFLDALQSSLSVFKENAEKESEASEQFQDEHQDEQTVSVLMKAGYTRQEAEKMKNLDKMSDEEKMMLANQMLQKNYGFADTAEAHKVARYDSTAQQRWAKATSTMVIADVQSEPEKNKQKQLEIKNNLDLQDEMQYLKDSLLATENKYFEMLTELELDADTALSEMNPEIDKLYKDLAKGNGNTDQIINKIVALRQNYCEKFTPRYLRIIEGYKGYVAEHFQQYFRLEELQMKLAENQGVLKDPNYTPGKLAMGKAGTYASMVHAVFKYNLNADVGAQFIGY